MIKKDITQKNYAKSYIIAAILVTWIVTIILFVNPVVGLNFFAIIMFIPAILAIIFNKIQHKSSKCFIKKINLKSIMFGIFYPIIFVLICAIVSQLMGIGKFNSQKMLTLKDIITIVITIIVNLFVVLGEEYGWRGYLLPELTKEKGKTKATIILGIVWALYHVPAVFLLAKTTGMSNPILLCVIQACVVFTISFPFSYCYYLSGNIIPVLFFHSVWNVINTTILGDIYTNKQGIIEGNLLYINGEGFLGLIIGVVFIYWFINKLNKADAAIDLIR